VPNEVAEPDSAGAGLAATGGPSALLALIGALAVAGGVVMERRGQNT